jgi:hypothetical protein
VPNKRNTSSNLFSIDFDAIERILEEANSRLIDDAQQILARASEIPSDILSVEDAENAKEMIRRLRQHTKEVSGARLSDGRPFTEATKIVRNWFAATEKKLKTADEKLSYSLANYVRKRNDRSVKQDDTEIISEDIGHSYDGKPIVNVTDYTSPTEGNFEEALPDVNVDLVWEVDGFDREVLPLEELRPYLTDHAIIGALKAHLKEHGVNNLKGVTYRQSIPKTI